MKRGSFWTGELRLLAGGTFCLVTFLLLARQDWTGVTPAWDVAVFAWAQGWTLPGLAALMWAVSWPGWIPQSWIIILAITGVIGRRDWRLGLTLLTIAVGAQLLVRALKDWIGRARPSAGVQAEGPADASFPSGHATHYTLLLGMVAYLAWTRMSPGPLRRLLVGVCVVLIILVGPSRVYLGQHWPSDVLGGYLLGMGLLLTAIATIRPVHRSDQ